MHARSMRFAAQPGRADELAVLLVRVADGLRDAPGCLSWLVARATEAEDEVWVQEVWESEAAAHRALEAADDGDGPTPADVIALCAGAPQRTDLAVVGGVGFRARPSDAP